MQQISMSKIYLGKPKKNEQTKKTKTEEISSENFVLSFIVRDEENG